MKRFTGDLRLEGETGLFERPGRSVFSLFPGLVFLGNESENQIIAFSCSGDLHRANAAWIDPATGHLVAAIILGEVTQ